jgi:hypothetical protein
MSGSDVQDEAAPVRRGRRRWIVGGVAVVAIGAAIALPIFEPWTLFVETTVDESIPTAASPIATPAPSSASAAPTARPSSPAPARPVVLARGRFISHEHTTTGTAALLRLPDGTRVLRIEDLDTSNGPDLRVWLSDAKVRPGVAGWRVFDDGRYLELGELKGNRGNQNYVVPADAEIDDLTSVSVWCARFRVSFGAAELRASA